MKSRNWLHCFVIIALTAALPSCGSTPPAQTADIDSTLLGVFPVDSSGILFFDVAELREMGLASGFIEAMTGDEVPEEFGDFADSTGLDPIEDTQQVMAGRAGGDPFLVAIRFSGDSGGVDRFFEERGTVPESHGGRAIYRPDPEGDWTVTFVDDLAILGSSASVRSALDRMADGPSVLKNEETMAEILAIGEGNQVWGFGSFADLVPEGVAPPVATDLVIALETIAYGVRLDSGVTARATGTFETPEAASRAGDLLRGILALGQMNSAGEPDMMELMGGFQVRNASTAVEIDFTVTQELLDRLADSIDPDLPESPVE